MEPVVATGESGDVNAIGAEYAAIPSMSAKSGATLVLDCQAGLEMVVSPGAKEILLSDSLIMMELVISSVKPTIEDAAVSLMQAVGKTQECLRRNLQLLKQSNFWRILGGWNIS